MSWNKKTLLYAKTQGSPPRFTITHYCAATFKLSCNATITRTRKNCIGPPQSGSKSTVGPTSLCNRP